MILILKITAFPSGLCCLFVFTVWDGEIYRNCCNCKVSDFWKTMINLPGWHVLYWSVVYLDKLDIYKQEQLVSDRTLDSFRNCKSRLQWRWPAADTSRWFRGQQEEESWCVGTECTRCFGAVPCEWRRWKHWTDVWCSLPIYLHSPPHLPALLTLKEC